MKNETTTPADDLVGSANLVGLKKGEIMDELIEVSKSELSILCEGVLEAWETLDYSDNRCAERECKFCYADDANGELKHKLDCPVLIAQSMKPNKRLTN